MVSGSTNQRAIPRNHQTVRTGTKPLQAIIDALRSGLPIRFVAASTMLPVSEVRAIGRRGYVGPSGKAVRGGPRRLISAVAAGVPHRLIARRFFVHTATVHKIVRKHRGFSLAIGRPRKLNFGAVAAALAAGSSPKEVAKQYGVDVRAVRYVSAQHARAEAAA